MRQRGQGNRGSTAEALGAEASDEGAERIGHYSKGRDPRGLRLIREIRLEQLWYEDRAVSLGQSYGDLAGMRGQACKDLPTFRIVQSNVYIL